MQRLHKLVTVIILCSLVVAMTTACGKSIEAEVNETSSVTSVSTATPVAAADQNVVTVFGQVEPVNWVGLSFPRSGEIEAVLVVEGESVVAGQPLARLRTTDLELVVDAAEAMLATVQARLAELSASPRAEEISVLETDLAAAQAALSAAVAERDRLKALPSLAAVTDAEARVAEAVASELTSRYTHDRRIANDNLGWPEEKARYEWHADTLALAAAQAYLEQVQAGAPEEEMRSAWAAVSDAVALRDRSQTELDLLLAGPRPETLAVLEAEIEEAEISLAQARLALDESVLEAPFDGTVVSLSVRPFQAVIANTPVIVLADLTRFQVTAADLDELYVASVKPGQPATITFDALPGRQFTGQVAFVTLRATAARMMEEEGSTYTVIVTLDEADPELRWGMAAIVKIMTENSE